MFAAFVSLTAGKGGVVYANTHTHTHTHLANNNNEIDCFNFALGLKVWDTFNALPFILTQVVPSADTSKPGLHWHWPSPFLKLFAGHCCECVWIVTQALPSTDGWKPGLHSHAVPSLVGLLLPGQLRRGGEAAANKQKWLN